MARALKEMPTKQTLSGATYAESTKARIFRVVLKQPGITVSEIAQKLRLKEKRISSFLRNEGKKRYGLVVRKKRWYSPSTTSMSEGIARSNTFGSIETPKRLPKKDPYEADFDFKKWAPERTVVCNRLSTMGADSAEAILRVMSIKELESAFLEDEFVMLPDEIKALLGDQYAYKMEQIERREPDEISQSRSLGITKISRQSIRNSLWVILGFAVIMQMWPVVFCIALMIWLLFTRKV